MKKNNIYTVFILLIIFLVVAGFFLFFANYKLVSIGERKFIAELALTDERREKGLGKRSHLCQNCAMFFDFKKKGNYIFWMKNMEFDLDIIWITDDRIVYLEKNVSRESPYKKINPNINADKVLEINAGLSGKFGFKVGDRVEF